MKKILLAMATMALLLSGCNSITTAQKTKLEKQANQAGKQQLIQYFAIYTDNGDTERANIFGKKLSADEQMKAIKIFDKLKDEMQKQKKKNDLAKLERTINILYFSQPIFKKWNYLTDFQKSLEKK